MWTSVTSLHTVRTLSNRKKVPLTCSCQKSSCSSLDSCSSLSGSDTLNLLHPILLFLYADYMCEFCTFLPEIMQLSTFMLYMQRKQTPYLISVQSPQSIDDDVTALPYCHWLIFIVTSQAGKTAGKTIAPSTNRPRKSHVFLFEFHSSSFNTRTLFLIICQLFPFCERVQTLLLFCHFGDKEQQKVMLGNQIMFTKVL